METVSRVDSASARAPSGVAAAGRDGWRPMEHRELKRRAAGARAVRKRRPTLPSPLRDAFETWRVRARKVQLAVRIVTVALVVLAVADVLDDAPQLRVAALVGAVLTAGAASLLALATSEPDAINPTQTRRWQLQAVASAVVMFMLMANGGQGGPGDLLWFLIVVGAAS